MQVNTKQEDHLIIYYPPQSTLLSLSYASANSLENVYNRKEDLLQILAPGFLELPFPLNTIIHSHGDYREAPFWGGQPQSNLCLFQVPVF